MPDDELDAWGDPIPDDEGYEDGDWGLCERCGTKLHSHEAAGGICGNCAIDMMDLEDE
jgi:hypothetical protein